MSDCENCRRLRGELRELRALLDQWQENEYGGPLNLPPELELACENNDLVIRRRVPCADPMITIVYKEPDSE